MQQDRKIRAVIRVLGEPEIRKGDELVFICPKCTHRKPKLSVNVKTDWFHCWICEWKGKNLVPVLRLKGESEDLRLYIDSLGGPRRRVVDNEKKYDVPALPSEFRTLTREWRSPYYRNAISYLKCRGITDKDILRWKLGYCEDGEYRNRIIVPSFDRMGELNFFVGRLFAGSMGQTYKHGNFNKDIVWNELMVDWESPVVVVEGPFDAMKVRDNVIALQGSILENSLLVRLALAGQDVYLAMDADAMSKQIDIIRELIGYGVRCFWVPLDGRRDVGEMDHDEFCRAAAQATPMVSGLDLLKARIHA